MTNFGVGDRFLGILFFCLVCFKLLPFSLFVISCLGIFTAWTIYEYELKKCWHKRGVPGPIGNPFFGNMFEFMKHGVIPTERNNMAKYGKSYGEFSFDRPNFVTIDMDIIRQIAIKEFSHFQNRYNLIDSANIEIMQNNIFRNLITMKRDDEWKRVRNRVSPAFTTGKLKKLIPTLQHCTNRLCKHIESEFIATGKELPLIDLFGFLVQEEIARGGYSLDVNVFDKGKSGDAFVEKLKEFFAPHWRKFTVLILAICPVLHYAVWKYARFDAFKNPTETYFVGLLEGMYEQRKADPKADEKYNDIFQLLLNAVDEKEEEKEMEGRGKRQENGNMGEEDADILHKELASYRGSKRLTKLEMIAQSFVLLVAGYETTGATLQFCIYLLTMFPEHQQRLREEINAVMGDDEQITYEHLRKMHFLKAVIMETLRIYPIATAVNRECNKEVTINGVQFKPGDLFTLSIYSVHHCEEYYPEPEKFDPERFLPEQRAQRDPMTFLGFGLGPRNCVGMRFAEFQMQVALAILVRRFHFLPGPSSQPYPIEVLSTELLRPKNPLFVMAERI